MISISLAALIIPLLTGNETTHQLTFSCSFQKQPL